jgi:hypothetical protein
MRCIDSARLVSGNLPMSSATMLSIAAVSVRFSFSAALSEARKPVTMMSGVAASDAGGAPSAVGGAGSAGAGLRGGRSGQRDHQRKAGNGSAIRSRRRDFLGHFRSSPFTPTFSPACHSLGRDDCRNYAA